MRVVLFDIDGTLIDSGGAGSRALRRALAVHYSLREDVDQIQFDGKTDPQIVREILAWFNRDDLFSAEEMPSFFSLYLSFLREELSDGPGFRILDGVRELVTTLYQREDFLIGLATGNIQAGAQLKLDRARLGQFFPFGGFGSDSEDRTELTRKAVERAHEHAKGKIDNIFLVGDTPRDIIHGKEANVITIAVASGNFSSKMLASYKPDLVLTGLDPVEPIIEFMSL